MKRFIGLCLTFFLFAFNENVIAQYNILAYATKDAGDGYDMSYFDESLPTILANQGYSVDVTDRMTTPLITDALLSQYDQLWIFSTGRYSEGCFNSEEIASILNFRNSGRGILVATDRRQDESPFHNYQNDANQITIPLGVTYYGETYHGELSEPIQPIFDGHPLFIGVTTIAGDPDEGLMEISSPVEVVATYLGDDLIAVLNDGSGRVVFEVAFERFWDDGAEGHSWIMTGDTPQYVRNIADWLSNQPTIPTLSEWGMIILGLLVLAAGTAAVILRRKLATA
jgi:hypothetical protein